MAVQGRGAKGGQYKVDYLQLFDFFNAELSPLRRDAGKDQDPRRLGKRILKARVHLYGYGKGYGGDTDREKETATVKIEKVEINSAWFHVHGHGYGNGS